MIIKKISEHQFGSQMIILLQFIEINIILPKDCSIFR